MKLLSGVLLAVLLAVLSGCAGMQLTPITDVAKETWKVAPIEMQIQQETTRAQNACFATVQSLVADLRVEEMTRMELDNQAAMSTASGEVALQFRKSIEAMSKMVPGYKSPADQVATAGFKYCSEIPNWFAYQMLKSNNRSLVTTSIVGGLTKALSVAVPWIAGADIAKSLIKARGDVKVGGDYVGGDYTGRDRTGGDSSVGGDQSHDETGRDRVGGDNSYNNPGRDYNGRDNNSTGDDNRGDNNCAERGDCDEEEEEDDGIPDMPASCPSGAVWNGSYWQISETDTCSCDSRVEGRC